MRQGRRGENRDVQEFLEEAVTPRGQFGAGAAGAGAGRGSGSYERFIKAHKETVLTEEDKRFKTWSSWKDQLEDFKDDGQEYVCTWEVIKKRDLTWQPPLSPSLPSPLIHPHSYIYLSLQ